jgi:hypothetical protein
MTKDIEGLAKYGERILLEKLDEELTEATHKLFMYKNKLNSLKDPQIPSKEDVVFQLKKAKRYYEQLVNFGVETGYDSQIKNIEEKLK